MRDVVNMGDVNVRDLVDFFGSYSDRHQLTRWDTGVATPGEVLLITSSLPA